MPEEHLPEMHLCAYKPGTPMWWIVTTRILPMALAFLVCAKMAYDTRGYGWAALTVLCVLSFIFYIVVIFDSVREISFGVMARLEKVQQTTRGPGAHEKVPGDELHQFSKNPISVVVPFEGQCLDGPIAKMQAEFIFKPHERIANEEGLNAYATWVLEGEWDAIHANDEIKQAIIRPFKSLGSNMIQNLNKATLKKCFGSFGIFLESEGSLETPLHRNHTFRAAVSTRHGHTVEPLENEGQTLLWYHTYRRDCRAELDRCNSEFEKLSHKKDLTAEEIAPFVSRYEREVGCITHGLHVTTPSFDEETEKADRAVYVTERRAAAAKKKVETADEAAEKHKQRGGDPDFAYGAAMRAQGVEVDANVSLYKGNAPKSVKAGGAAGHAAGDAFKDND